MTVNKSCILKEFAKDVWTAFITILLVVAAVVIFNKIGVSILNFLDFREVIFDEYINYVFDALFWLITVALFCSMIMLLGLAIILLKEWIALYIDSLNERCKK